MERFPATNGCTFAETFAGMLLRWVLEMSGFGRWLIHGQEFIRNQCARGQRLHTARRRGSKWRPFSDVKLSRRRCFIDFRAFPVAIINYETPGSPIKHGAHTRNVREFAPYTVRIDSCCPPVLSRLLHLPETLWSSQGGDLIPSQGWHSPAPERHCLTLIRTWPPWSHWQRSVRALQWEDECAKHNESPTADDIRITLNQLMCLIACPELNWKHWDFV